MQIFVKTLTGQTITLGVSPCYTVEQVKLLIEEREGIAVEEQRLLAGESQLDDAYTLLDCGVESESTLHLSLRLLGGGKKRKKKKQYTKPKKIKHKKKKVKLAVLKYYSVDDSGNFQRTKRECNAEECGAGIFMARHENRQYCGKCHLTYVYTKGEEADQ
mmetsp:Transcript_815/g.2114  ORF Transcript_815/g.2114 Transcript_815/m.2114 type:complete len:160 (+) Transcript_815:91-570(+)